MDTICRLVCIYTEFCNASDHKGVVHTADSCLVQLSPWSYCCWCDAVVLTPLCLSVFVVVGDVIAVVVFNVAKRYPLIGR